jgi:subtilisin family serine protease
VSRSPRLVLSGAVALATLTSYAVASAADASGPAPTGRVLVQFAPGASGDVVRAAVASVGAAEEGTLRDLGVHVLRVPAASADAVVAALSHRPGVNYAEVDGATQATVTPNDPDWSIQWGPAKINTPAAWDKTTGSSGVVVAVLDTGVQFNHPDLQGRTVSGYDFVNNDSDPADDNGHGTSTAGIIGAASNNAVGLAGMCWSCELMPVKVLDANGSGDYAGLANGITWATDHGAQVISMSLAGTTDSSTLHNAVQYAHSHGVVLVAAAGNSGSSTPMYPAAYPEVLGVAGTTSNDALYSWSDYGSWVKVAAPGCNDATVIGSGYGTFCGTSSATPVVAGVAALAKSLQPSATNSAIETAIESSAVRIGSSVAYGRVDAAAALSALGSGGNAPPPTGGGTATTSSSWSGSFTGKTTTKTYSASMGAGTASATLTFSKAGSMTLSMLNSSGATVATTSGASPLSLTADVSAGSYTYVVSGPAKSSYTLKATYPAP